MGTELAGRVAEVREWLYRDEVRHSRLIWRLGHDRKLDPPWPYRELWYDPAGAALLDLRGHPLLDNVNSLPWFQADGDDEAALAWLLSQRLPDRCQVLLDQRLAPLLGALGDVSPDSTLDVYLCRPGELGAAALPCEPTRLTLRHRALVADDDWRPEDLPDEVDEARGGVRWGLIRDDKLVSRLLVQPVSDHLVEVADLHTRPDHRRRGSAAALVQNIVRRAHEKGLGVTYSVHPSNVPSVDLAKQVGFTYAFTWERYWLTRR